MLQDLRAAVEKMEPDSGSLLDFPGKKNVGNSQTLQPGAAATNPAAQPNEELVVNVVGEDEQATVVSVTLISPIADVSPATDELFASTPVARVQWGVGGTQAQAFIDYVNGAQFSVPASFLRVYARNEFGASPPATPLQPTNPVKLGAFVSYLPLKNQRVQRTLNGLIPTATPTIFVVPPFATDVTIFRLGGAAAPAFTADFLRSSAGPLVVLYTIATAAGALFPKTPIANGVRFIQITHAAGADVLFQLVFDLAL